MWRCLHIHLANVARVKYRRYLAYAGNRRNPCKTLFFGFVTDCSISQWKQEIKKSSPKSIKLENRSTLSRGEGRAFLCMGLCNTIQESSKWKHRIVILIWVWYAPIRTTVLQGGWPLFLHRMGVVLMDKKPFDFKDLMAFGMFVLALLTFVFTFCQ